MRESYATIASQVPVANSTVNRNQLEIYDRLNGGAGPSNKSCGVKTEEQVVYEEVIFVKNGGRKADYEMKYKKTAGGTSKATGQNGDEPIYSTIADVMEYRY